MVNRDWYYVIYIHWLTCVNAAVSQIYEHEWVSQGMILCMFHVLCMDSCFGVATSHSHHATPCHPINHFQDPPLAWLLPPASQIFLQGRIPVISSRVFQTVLQFNAKTEGCNQTLPNPNSPWLCLLSYERPNFEQFPNWHLRKQTIS